MTPVNALNSTNLVLPLLADYLTIPEVVRFQHVCKAWKEMISFINGQTLKIHDLLITVPLRGRVVLRSGSWNVSCGDTNATDSCVDKLWGVKKAPHTLYTVAVMGEPYVSTEVYNQDSIENCREFHFKTVICKNRGKQGTWHDDYPRIMGRSFPWCLPLRFFIKGDGSYKNNGDTINLIYKSQLIVLTCTYEEETYDNEPIDSFSAAIAKRISHSLNHRMLLTSDIERAKTLAQTAPEWVSSHDSD